MFKAWYFNARYFGSNMFIGGGGEGDIAWLYHLMRRRMALGLTSR